MLKFVCSRTLSVPLKNKNLIAKLRSETIIMTPQTLKLVEKQGRSCVYKKLLHVHRRPVVLLIDKVYQCLVCVFPHHLARLSKKCNNGSYRVTPEWNQLVQASRTVNSWERRWRRHCCHSWQWQRCTVGGCAAWRGVVGRHRHSRVWPGPDAWSRQGRRAKVVSTDVCQEADEIY